MHKKCLLLSGVFFWSSIQISFAQIVFSKLNTIYEEKFDSLGTSKTANLPLGFEVQSSKGNFSQTTEFAGTTGLNAFSAISSFGVYNCGHGVNSTATDRALGFITSSNISSPSAYELICSFTNNTGATVDILDLWFDYEKYREGTRDWSLSLFHGDNPLSISNAATQGDQYFIADAGNTAVNPPLTFTKHVVISGLSIANGTDYYLKWVYQGVGGTTNAQAIAIDNVHLTLKNEALIFRTKKSGSWHDTAIWEFSPTSSINWVNATLLPSHFLDSVIIQSGHHVQIEHAADLDRILVQSGGTLSFSQCNITVFDAANRNLVVENNAKLIYNGDATVLTKLSSVVFIHSQAVLQTNHKNGVDIFGNVNFETPFEQYLIFNAAQSQRTGSIPTVCKTLEIDIDSLLYLEDDLTISGTLKLNQGVIITDTFKLCLGTSTANKGSLSYTSGSIKGTFVRWFDGTNSGSSSGLFPLESNNNKKFVTVEFSSAPSAGGTLTASYINSS
ncbi:MAG: hypothetical protein M0R38_07565, partial [Bacteroidia bacterium]|nr:hypothetical protein [Bacteroidia bacterium]